MTGIPYSLHPWALGADPRDFGSCILTRLHCGHFHFRFLWKMWPLISTI